MITVKTYDGEVKIDIMHPAFLDGYENGWNHPGFITKTVPDPIPNPHPAGSVAALHYAAGFETAIR